MLDRSVTRGAGFAFLLTMIACGGSDGGMEEQAAEMAESDTPAATPTLAVAEELGVRNARSPMEGVVTAGQPTEEQLEALRDAGFRNFISLRPTSEDGAGWEETHSADGSYDFDRLPIEGGDGLTRENVEAFAALMEEASGEPTVLYCGSSNRVGALLALKAHWIDGVPAEEAIEIGREGGLTRLEGQVREMLGLEQR